jgi:hypothetical protein
MTDLSQTIDPKSDQLNADDLIAGPRTITVTRVVGSNNKEQPISIYFEGDNGKPYKPCKSMRRVLVQLWDKDGSTYTGKMMTLYREPRVQYGGIDVGGVRISHLSHIESDTQLMLTTKRGKRDSYSVKRLVTPKPASAPAQASAPNGVPSAAFTVLASMIEATASTDELAALVSELKAAGEQKTVTPTELTALRDKFGAKKKSLEEPF